MGFQGNVIVLLFGSLCIYLTFTLVKVLYKLWWTPIRMQNFMASQGIRGPSYRFIHGSTREVTAMKKEAMAKPMTLSHNIFPKVLPQIYTWINTYGRNYLSWYGPKAHFVVSEPELVKEILNNKDRSYPKGDVPAYFRLLLGNGITTSEGEKWTKHRKLREIEVYDELRLLTSEIISRTAFGSSYLEGKNIFDMLTKLSLLINRNLYKLRLPGISKFWRTRDEIESENLVKGIRNSVMEIIKKREEKVKTGEAEGFGNDFLGVLLNSYHDADEKKRISIEDVVDECKTFYIAGQESTNSLLSWTILLLAIHTDWQEEARKEVLKIFGQQKPNLDGIAKLKIVSMIINETLRLYPPVLGLIRKVEREVQIGQLILPANMNLYIANVALQHDPETWGDDVHLFKPERFSGGVAKATNNNPASFFPFGIGPRTCVGLNFATAEAKITLSMILQKYFFTLSPTYIHSPYEAVTLRPRNGVQVILHSL
ncbi:cytochrome P450 [Salix suchowensis]|nr:cytochrome P450 [Salix suchowensis]